MKTSSFPRRQSRSGVALIIVLGLLSVLTLLSVAFAISMRVERLAARNYADGVRAEQLVQVCLARAMEDVSDSMVKPKPVVYPDWENNREPTGSPKEAFGSYRGPAGAACSNILGGEAANVIPESLLADARPVANRYCQWTNVVVSDGARSYIYGRIAYLVVNTSGLLDANFAGGLARTSSTTIAELDISGLSEMTSVPNFLSNRTDYVRFETLTELLALNTNNGPVQAGKPALSPPVQNLFAYSFDVGRDQYFKSRANFGTPSAALDYKFNVNAITNYKRDAQGTYTDPLFKTEYYDRLVQFLTDAGLTWKPEDTAWTIINWIDTDRYPQGADTTPEWHTEGGEAMPLINEIVFQKRVTGSVTQGEFAVEVWYPYVGVDCGANYSIEIEAKQPPSAGSATTTNIDIPNMDYFEKTGPQFLVVTSAPLPSTSNASIRVTTYLGLSSDAGRRKVDRAMDRDNYTDFTIDKPAWAVDDPRSNGKPDYWMRETAPTLGRLNDQIATETKAAMAQYLNKQICQPWKWSGDTDPHHLRQGLPIIVRNGPMVNIGELGYIFLSNRENASPAMPPYKWYWGTIDLMHRDEGAYLLDHLTVRATNIATRGLVSISTKQEEILKALLFQSQIGYSTNIATIDAAVRDEVNNVVQAVLDRQRSGTNYISFQDLFDGETPGGTVGPGGKIADRFRELGQAAWSKAGKPVDTAGDAIREGAFRNILDLITFRQNIFTIILAAQLLGPDESTPIAEKRGVATVYRDAYTGNYFVRSFKWLND